MRRILKWPELSADLRAQALAKLTRISEGKARYDGTVLGYAWPERIAPRLRYTLAARGTVVWDCDPLPTDRAKGFSLFTLPPLPLTELKA